MTLESDKQYFKGEVPDGLESDYVSIASIEDINGKGFELRIYVTLETETIHIGESVYAGKEPPTFDATNFRMYFPFSSPEDVQEFCTELMRICDLTWPSEKL